MKKSKKNIFLVVGIILALFGLIELTQLTTLIYDEIHHSDKRVPISVKTIEEFRKWKPSYTDAYKIEIRGSTFYIIEGDFARSRPSSKSEYYFDNNGNYLGWNIDPGDFTTLDILNDKEAKRSKININEIGQ